MSLIPLQELEPYTVPEPEPGPLPYVTLALDPLTGDLAMPPHFLYGVDAVLQKVFVRFRFLLGEWFLDRRLGVPYFRSILIKNPDQRAIESIFRQVLVQTPGIKGVLEMVTVFDRPTRALSVSFIAALENDQTVVVKDQTFVIT